MAVCAEGTWGVIEPAGAGGHPVPPERVPCPSSLDVLAVSPPRRCMPRHTAPSCILHWSGSVHHPPSLPRCLPGQQQPSPDSMAQPWQPISELLLWHCCSGFCMCSHDPPLLSPGVLCFLLLLTLPAHCPLHFLSPWQALLEVVKEEASSASPSSSQQTRPSSSILPCKCCDTFILFLPVPFPPVCSQAGPGLVVHSIRKYFETLVTPPEGYWSVWDGAHGVGDWDRWVCSAWSKGEFLLLFSAPCRKAQGRCGVFSEVCHGGTRDKGDGLGG